MQKQSEFSEICKLGFGTWGIGGDTGAYSGYGPTNDSISELALEKAIELGINFFDTAPPYGNGKAEELLGRVIQGVRKSIFLLTKIGVHTWADKPNYSKDNVEKSIELSLQRMKTEYLDIAIFHSLKQINNKSINSGFQELLRLKSLGVLRKIGFSLKSPIDLLALDEFLEYIDVIEVNYNILDVRLYDNRLLELLSKNKILVVGRTPFAFGFLTEKIERSTKFHNSDHRASWPKTQVDLWVTSRERVQEIFKDHNYHDPISRLALRYCLCSPLVDVVIPGMLTPSEVETNYNTFKMSNLDLNCFNEVTNYSLNNNSFNGKD